MKNDIYFEPNYGKLYEKMENGKCEEFKFEKEYGTIRHMYIKRQIPISCNGKNYYDLVTPYGYGGPFIVECSPGMEKKLLQEFKCEFHKYCLENDIISEFVRFHPLIDNANDFFDCYDVCHIRNTIGTNLKDYSQPIEIEFSKSCIKNIKKALKNGVVFNVIESPDNLGDFKEIYYSTMERNNASEYYYFDDEYFLKCLNLFKDNIVLVEATYNSKTIAMGLYFIYDNIIHVHLSGTLSEYLKLSPAYILRYGITMWGKEKGYSIIHHGGGRSNSNNDSLYLFKRQFGNNTQFKFHIGKKIWNEEIYTKLCDIVGVDKNTDFFPAYRIKR